MEGLRNEKLEDVAKELLRAKNKLATAKASFSAAYEASKEAMLEEKIDSYPCQDCNFDLLLTHRDDEVKLKERKHED